jgi:hypothetical protein
MKRTLRLPPVYHKLNIEVKHGLWYITTEIYEVTAFDTLHIKTWKRVPDYDEKIKCFNQESRRGWESEPGE